MNFSPQQEGALTAVQQWLHSDEQTFRLFGYAGTGKTTLARHLNADFYAAYTGKAAHVLRQKGCRDASTIHSLIYCPKEKSHERLMAMQTKRLDPDLTPQQCADLDRLIAEEKTNLHKPAFTLNLDSPLRSAGLLVIDECSMVDARMGRDLLSFGCKILVLGDPAQLPPVMGGGFFTAQKPDVLLSEIHRQARGNPILDLATRIREGQRWQEHELIQSAATAEEAVAAEQIICGRNATRHRINRRIRTLLGHTDRLPVPGDRLVCLKNNHEFGLLNGALYEVAEVLDRGHCLQLELDTGLMVAAHREPFLGEEVDPQFERNFEKFDFGYALTCHKSQGSQWDSVLVFDESECFRGSARRWLYTAVTRAAHSLKVVSPC